MRVTQLGDGEPEVAIVAGIHGDEPCGVRAVDRLVEEKPPVNRPVSLVVANERAIDAGRRYVDEDLNRAFPGDVDAKTHEGRLARELTDVLSGCLTLSMHSTQSHAEPFAIVEGIDEMAMEICPCLPVAAMVETGPYADGRLFTGAETVEVECGLQGSAAAAENADRLARAFLTATDVLPGDAPARELPAYRLVDRIDKAVAETYEVFVENFERVEVGQSFAAADGTKQVAGEPFYPVLMSSYGYRDVFGYAAERVDVLANEPAGD